MIQLTNNLEGSSCIISRNDSLAYIEYIRVASAAYQDWIMAAADSIRDSDLWMLMTDGEITDNEVASLTRVAERENLLQVPVIFMIFGPARKTPMDESVSIGVCFCASTKDAAVLYQDVINGKTYVIDAKGIFEASGHLSLASLMACHSRHG